MHDTLHCLLLDPLVDWSMSTESLFCQAPHKQLIHPQHAWTTQELYNDALHTMGDCFAVYMSMSRMREGQQEYMATKHMFPPCRGTMLSWYHFLGHSPSRACMMIAHQLQHSTPAVAHHWLYSSCEHPACIWIIVVCREQRTSPSAPRNKHKEPSSIQCQPCHTTSHRCQSCCPGCCQGRCQGRRSLYRCDC